MLNTNAASTFDLRGLGSLNPGARSGLLLERTDRHMRLRIPTTNTCSKGIAIATDGPMPDRGGDCPRRIEPAPGGIDCGHRTRARTLCEGGPRSSGVSAGRPEQLHSSHGRPNRSCAGGRLNSSKSSIYSPSISLLKSAHATRDRKMELDSRATRAGHRGSLVGARRKDK